MNRPTAAELLATPEALLTRTHLRELGLERRATDAAFRALPVVVLPGYSRPLVRGRTISRCSTSPRTTGSRASGRRGTRRAAPEKTIF
jgi:hypothetical protein